jgi:CheY-like chemotaxis protein
MGLVLAAIGLALAGLLSVILWSISLARRKSDAENRQKSEFLATMSHEIRTPMNAILGITEIHLQDKTIRADIKEALSKIYNSGNLLLGIINDILDLSKIEAGKMELDLVKYNVASLINDVVQLNKIRYESKPVEFKLRVDETVPLLLLGDELRIKQILNNLLSNGFKYTEKGGVSLSVSVEYAARGVATHVTLVFTVNDTGQGMTAEQVRKMFDEYSRFNMAANRTTQGTGLGMTITQNLVGMMDGTISVESAPGKGTKVVVRLPQRNIGTAVSGVVGRELAENLEHFRMNSATQTEKAQLVYDPMPYGKVLVVDDVETNLYVAKGLMAPYGLAIETALSGFVAVDKIKEGKVYDIVFMDHMMPKMDGIETTKLIRGLGYKRPVIALTANALAGQAEMFMNNGFDGFISKPIDIRQLNFFLNKLVRDIQPYDVIEAARREKEAKEEAAKPPAAGDKEFLHEKLLAVQAACAVQDKKTAKDALVELKRKTWPPRTKELLNTVIERLMQGKFEEAATLAKEFDETYRDVSEA